MTDDISSDGPVPGAAPSRRQPAERLAVVGQGYVGLPLALRAVEVGFDVVGFEVDRRKVDGLRAGRSHLADVADEPIREAIASGRYRPTDDPADLAGFDVAVISVPTPLTHGVPDLSFIESAIDALMPHITTGSTVILESTTFPGTTEEVVAGRIAAETGLKPGVDVFVGYSPERIDPGNATWSLVTTPKVVAGLTADCLQHVQDFFDRLVDHTVPVSTTGAAELTKLLENTFRHVNVALINELATHAHSLGIDIWEVVEAASTKPFGFMAFRPGPGVGGHCLPVDPSYLSWRVEQQLGARSRFVEIANDVNTEMPRYVVRRVQDGLNRRGRAVHGARILVLGLAYKPNTNDARESPATGVVTGLLELGADVQVHDTWVGAHPVDTSATRVDLTAELVRQTDVVVLLVDHRDVDYDVVLDHASYVFDTRCVLVGDNVETL